MQGRPADQGVAQGGTSRWPLIARAAIRSAGMQPALRGAMKDPPAVMVGFAAAISLLLTTAGCSSSNNLVGSADASEDATGKDGEITSDAGAGLDADGGVQICVGGILLGGKCVVQCFGCECYDADTCPASASTPAGPQVCYVWRTALADGSTSATCAAGLVQCIPGGPTMSFGATPVGNDGFCQDPQTEHPSSLDGGPDGAFAVRTIPRQARRLRTPRQMAAPRKPLSTRRRLTTGVQNRVRDVSCRWLARTRDGRI